MLGHRKLEADDYLTMLKRRIWLILIPAVLFSVIGVVVTFFIPAKYLSQTLILIDQQKVPEDIVKPVISSDLDSRLSAMKEQILSRSTLVPIIEQYNLYGGKHASMDDRLDLVRKDVLIKPIQSQIARSGGLPGFFIAFTASDARTAQLVCGKISSLFVGENLKNRENDAQGTTDFIKGQLDDAKRDLDDQDAKLAAFQRQYVGKLPTEGGTNVNMLTSLNTQLEAATQSLGRLEQDKSYQQSLLTQELQAQAAANSAAAVNAGAGGTAPGTQPAGPTLQQQQAELHNLLTAEADLKSHYTADYPDVINIERRITDLRKEIAQSEQASDAAPAKGSAAVNLNVPSRFDSPAVQQLRAQLRATELGLQEKRAEQAQLGSAVRLYQDRIASSPLVEEQYKELTRDYDTAKRFYDDLLVKSNQSKMATDLERQQQGQQFRVLDPPNLPDAPTFPNRAIFFGGGLILGLALGFGMAAFLEYKDTALRSERDVYAFTRLPTLGLIALSTQLTEKDKQTRTFNPFKRFFKPKAKESLASVTN
jgi:polysaccharide chain length determinant protein (PEP-CTERM system associated)